MSDQGDGHFLSCLCHTVGMLHGEAVCADNDDEWTDLSWEGAPGYDSLEQVIAMEEEMMSEQGMEYGVGHFCYDCCTFHEEEEEEEEEMEYFTGEEEAAERGQKTNRARIGEQQKVFEARRTRRALQNFNLGELKAQLVRTKSHIEVIKRFKNSAPSSAESADKDLLCKVNALRVENVLRQDYLALQQAIYDEIVRQLRQLLRVSETNRSQSLVKGQVDEYSPTATLI